MATPFYGNWACNSISDLMRAPETDAREVAQALSTQPEFLASIQGVIDYRNDPGYNPDQPGGDPAMGVVSVLLEKLAEPGPWFNEGVEA
jgi:hypothetical protein